MYVYMYVYSSTIQLYIILLLELAYFDLTFSYFTHAHTDTTAPSQCRWRTAGRAPTAPSSSSRLYPRPGWTTSTLSLAESLRDSRYVGALCCVYIGSIVFIAITIIMSNIVTYILRATVIDGTKHTALLTTTTTIYTILILPQLLLHAHTGGDEDRVCQGQQTGQTSRRHQDPVC